MAFAVAVVLTPVTATMGARLGLVDHPGALKIHGRPVPVTGGPAVVGAVLLTLWPVTGMDGWLAGATCLALSGGLLDDLRSLPPWSRLVAQAAAGGLLVAGGFRLEPFGAFGGIVLVLATVACSNAVNMLDGQDGLAAGLAAVAAFGLAGVLAAEGSAAATPIVLGGALAGFLVWNRPPARVFLGDGGAYAVGVLLAASGAQATEAAGWHGLLAAGACLGVFAYELISTIVRRLASDAPAIRGDRDHSYDRMGVRLGSRALATAAFLVFGLAVALLGRAVLELAPPAALVLVGAAALLGALIDTRLLRVAATKGES